MNCAKLQQVTDMGWRKIYLKWTGRIIQGLTAAAITVFLSTAQTTAASAAPGNTGDPKLHQGVTNSKKAVLAKRERDKKVAKVRKQAHAKRKQAQSGK